MLLLDGIGFESTVLRFQAHFSYGAGYQLQQSLPINFIFEKKMHIFKFPARNPPPKTENSILNIKIKQKKPNQMWIFEILDSYVASQYRRLIGFHLVQKQPTNRRGSVSDWTIRRPPGVGIQQLNAITNWPQKPIKTWSCFAFAFFWKKKQIMAR